MTEFANTAIAGVWEDGHVTLMARVEDRPTAPNTAGTALLTAQITSLALSAFDIDVDPTTPIVGFNALALTPASVWSDTLAGWHVDSVGHNFRYVMGVLAVPTGGNRVKVQVKVTRSDGTIGWLAWLLNVRGINGQ